MALLIATAAEHQGTGASVGVMRAKGGGGEGPTPAATAAATTPLPGAAPCADGRGGPRRQRRPPAPLLSITSPPSKAYNRALLPAPARLLPPPSPCQCNRRCYSNAAGGPPLSVVSSPSAPPPLAFPPPPPPSSRSTRERDDHRLPKGRAVATRRRRARNRAAAVRFPTSVTQGADGRPPQWRPLPRPPPRATLPRPSQDRRGRGRWNRDIPAVAPPLRTRQAPQRRGGGSVAATMAATFACARGGGWRARRGCPTSALDPDKRGRAPPDISSRLFRALAAADPRRGWRWGVAARWCGRSRGGGGTATARKRLDLAEEAEATCGCGSAGDCHRRVGVGRDFL